MGIIRLPINTLSGGVGRQIPTKRLTSESENLDNCLVTLEKSVEKRPPLSKIAYSKDGITSTSSYLEIPYVTPPTTWAGGAGVGGTGTPNFNTDNLYFHYLDIDGYNRYCIIINRAAYTFDPTWVKEFTTTISGQSLTINLANFISVFRIEPTEWIEETVDLTTGTVANTSGFNRGVFEYITYGNKASTSTYRIANEINTVDATSIKDTFGSMDFDVGLILWNKLVPTGYMKNNAALELTTAGAFEASLSTLEYIHTGDVFNYKTAAGPNTLNPGLEDDLTQDTIYWTNVRDNIVYTINPVNLEEEEEGQNVENFSVIPQYPAIEVKNDVQDANGFKAWRSLYQLYDNPSYIPVPAGGFDFNKDHYHQTSPLPKEDRDGQTSYYGKGKVYFTRSGYLNFPSSFYRATRYGKNPYFERLRTEQENSVIDHRRMPLIIYKDTATDGKWRVKHMPMFPRRSGTEISNPGPTGFKRKERIQSMAIWKNRLWIATDNTLIASRTGNYYNLWIDDVQNVTDIDPIDVQASVGAYNKLSYIVPFQTIMFVASSGSVQFEIRGGSIDTGISPFNVELRPTSFYSTSKLVEPQRMGNNIFFMDSGRMYMYLSGSSFNDEYSTSMDLSTHCKGYLPTNYGAVTTNTAVNSIMMVDADAKNYLYFFTFRTNGDKVIQNAFYRWILSSEDSIQSIKAYEKDLYVVSKRSADLAGTKKLTVYLASLESVPYTAPLLDWLTTVPTNNITYNSLTQTTTITLPHYDPNVDYVILPSAWGTQAYRAIPITMPKTTIVQSGVTKTQVSIAGQYNTYPVYVGRSYQMNIELSQIVPRGVGGNDPNSDVAEGVLNLKRITFRHLNTGNYDIVISRRGRLDSPVTFYPFDLNSIISRTDELKIDSVGEHFVKVLSYSEACKIFIKSSYPTPCNISNIEVIGNFRIRNTSIE